MIWHICKLIWNRKRTNGLLILEIGISFIVLCLISLWAVRSYMNYHEPIGFQYDRIWQVQFGNPDPDADKKDGNPSLNHQHLLQAMKAFPEVEDACYIQMPVYGYSSSRGGYGYHNKTTMANQNYVNETFADVMKLDLIQGRWFEQTDNTEETIQSVIINQAFADKIFGLEDPVGKSFTNQGDGEDRYRVIGVLSMFKQGGEFDSNLPYLFYHHDMSQLRSGSFMIRVQPGTTATFEEELTKHLQKMLPRAGFNVQPLETVRRSFNKSSIIPLVIGGIIAGFLLIMVAFGLVGVLWQNITQRTVEIGLRRAMGSTANAIYKQTLGELFVMTTIGIILGLVIILQIPLLTTLLTDDVVILSTNIYFIALGLSFLLMYGLTMLAGFYPSRLATTIHPATALHYE